MAANGHCCSMGPSFLAHKALCITIAPLPCAGLDTTEFSTCLITALGHYFLSVLFASSRSRSMFRPVAAVPSLLLFVKLDPFSCIVMIVAASASIMSSPHRHTFSECRVGRLLDHHQFRWTRQPYKWLVDRQQLSESRVVV